MQRVLIVLAGAVALFVGLSVIVHGTGVAERWLAGGMDNAYVRPADRMGIHVIGHVTAGVSLLALSVTMLSWRPAMKWSPWQLAAAFGAVGVLVVLAAGVWVPIALADQMAASPPPVELEGPLQRSIWARAVSELALAAALGVSCLAAVLQRALKRPWCIALSIGASVAWLAVIAGRALSLAVDAITAKQAWGVYFIGDPRGVGYAVESALLALCAIAVGVGLLVMALARARPDPSEA